MGQVCQSLCCEKEKEGYRSLATNGSNPKEIKQIEKKMTNFMKKALNSEIEFEYFMDQVDWWKQMEPCYFTPEKFIFFYTNYLTDQKDLEERWKKVDVTKFQRSEFKPIKNEALMVEWKYLIRKGVPFSKARPIVLEIFKKNMVNNHSLYQSAEMVAFSGNMPTTFKNVPTFTTVDKLDEVLKLHFLNDKGLMIVRKLLWIFQKTVPKLDYCPMLPQVIALFLTFLSEAETYSVILVMIDQSKKLLDESSQYRSDEMRGLRWHFTLEREHFDKFIQSFLNFVKMRSKVFNKLIKHFERIGYDYVELFHEFFTNQFFGFLPLKLVLRVFFAYLNEGIKIFYRYGYAILRTFKEDILNTTDPELITDLLRDKCSKISEKQISKMIKKAYALRLTRIKDKFSKMEADVDDDDKAKVFYLPNIAENSNIVQREHFETLWEWLPRDFKMADPQLAYSSKKDGWSINTMYGRFEDKKDVAMLIFIKTDKGRIFGAFVDAVFKISHARHYFGTNESFVFELAPEEKVYKASGKNSNHLLCTSEYFSIGEGQKGAAISLDAELLNGHTYVSDTYQNDKLNGLGPDESTSFQCIAFEVYLID